MVEGILHGDCGLKREDSESGCLQRKIYLQQTEGHVFKFSNLSAQYGIKEV